VEVEAITKVTDRADTHIGEVIQPQDILRVDNSLIIIEIIQLKAAAALVVIFMVIAEHKVEKE